MARGTTEATSETSAPEAVASNGNAEGVKTRASRKGIKRGPSTIFVKYEIVDGSGNVATGYTARPVGVTRDKNAMVAMVLNKTLDGDYMQVSVPNSAE